VQSRGQELKVRKRLKGELTQKKNGEPCMIRGLKREKNSGRKKKLEGKEMGRTLKQQDTFFDPWNCRRQETMRRGLRGLLDKGGGTIRSPGSMSGVETEQSRNKVKIAREENELDKQGY